MSPIDRYCAIRDRVAGWWHTLEAAAGSERQAQAAERFERGQCMYDYPDGRWCFGTQTGGTPFCELHITDDPDEHPENWEDHHPDTDWHPGYDDGS